MLGALQVPKEAKAKGVKRKAPEALEAAEELIDDKLLGERPHPMPVSAWILP